MIISAASLFFRDVGYIVEVFLTFGIFFTPVFYDVRMFGDKGKWLLLNPCAPLLDGLSTCMVRHRVTGPSLVSIQPCIQYGCVHGWIYHVQASRARFC